MVVVGTVVAVMVVVLGIVAVVVVAMDVAVNQITVAHNKLLLIIIDT